MMLQDTHTIIDYFFANEEQMRQFILEWSSFIMLVSIGGFTRGVYNYDKMKKIRAFLTFKLVVFTFMVSFIAKHIVTQFGKEQWEVWLIPIVAFSGEIIITVYGEKAPKLLGMLLEKVSEMLARMLTKK